MSKVKFKDDEYKIIHEDIQKIRARPMQFISALGELGVFHLCKELIDNASDEALKKDSPCDTIYVYISNNEIRVRDNGRGIPTDKMQEVYETMQAGTNMTRSGGTTRGENGLGGSTCLLALSSYLKITSTRVNEKKKLTLEYKEATLVNKVLEDYNGTDHGLDVIYRPSKKVLGVNTIPVQMVVDWLKDFDYTLNRNIKLIYNVNGVDYETHHKDLDEYLNEYIPIDSRLCGTLNFSCEGDLTETFMEKQYDRHFSLDATLTYSNPENYKGEDIRQSWMNMIHTYQNGSHMDGVIKGFSKFITEQIRRKNKKIEDVNLKKDIEEHLSVVVKANCDFAHMFSSQAKHTVLNKDLGKAIEITVYEALSNIMSNNSVVQDIVDVIIGNHRARIEGEKARNISKLTRETKKWTKPDSYIPCSSVKSNYPKELFLVEGDSAGGGLTQARDAKYQAIFNSRGKIPNVWNLPLEVALKKENNLLLNVVKIMECGIGPTFDIKKLKFDKIIIATDADVDGFHIRTGYMTFFIKFMPELITAGKLYIVEPPLYEIIQGKKVSYVATQMEYIEECLNSIGDIEIDFPEI